MAILGAEGPNEYTRIPRNYLDFETGAGLGQRASDLRRVVADLERAIAAYQDKLKASRTLEVPAKRGPYQKRKAEISN
jgi:hypothetical protein